MLKPATEAPVGHYRSRLKRQAKHLIELIRKDAEAGDIDRYLYEMEITIRRFRDNER